MAEKSGGIALVTGGAAGLGQEIVRALGQADYRTVAIDLRAGEDEPTYDHFYPCDLADLDALEPLVARIEAEIGPIALLVNNAAHASMTALDDLTPDEIMKTLGINVAAVLILCRAVASRMAKRGAGAIVNIASVAGQRGSSQVAYGASKAGVINLTRTLGRHYAPSGVRINAVAPGLVDTGMGQRLMPGVREALVEATPLGRGASAPEVADVVCFLASDAAGYIIGETVSVNGGI